MALPKDDWTLRWADGRPFDAESESKRFVFGMRRQAQRVLPKLANFMEFGERIDAVGVGIPAGTGVRRFWVASDRALLVFATWESSDRILDDARFPYQEFTACRLRISPHSPLFFLKYGNLRVATSQRSIWVGTIPRRQAEALRAALAARLPTGILT